MLTHPQFRLDGVIDAHADFLDELLASSDVLVPLIPHKQMSMEQALEFCREDECVEVTPAHVRLRKVVLDQTQRGRTRARAKRD